MFRITSFSDISGQMTEGSAGADTVTVGAVLLPSGALSHIRKAIPRNLPKWRDASNDQVEEVVALVLQQSLSFSAGSIDKTLPQWLQFWQDAADVHRAIASMERASVGFLKAATLLKIILFGHASAACLGNAIVTKAIPDALRRNGILKTAEDVVIDNEIQGKDNREALVEAWRATNAHQPLSNSMGLERTATTPSLKSEQSEPLLLLADYIGGIVHAMNSRANTLAKSGVSIETARQAFARLRGSNRFMDFSGTVKLDYFAIYPDFQKFSRRSAA